MVVVISFRYIKVVINLITHYVGNLLYLDNHLRCSLATDLLKWKRQSYLISTVYLASGGLALHWRQNDHEGVSNHQPHGCLLNPLFRCRSKKTSKLRVTGLCVGNSPGPVNSPHKGPVTRKIFPFDDVIMIWAYEIDHGVVAQVSSCISFRFVIWIFTCTIFVRNFK